MCKMNPWQVFLAALLWSGRNLHLIRQGQIDEFHELLLKKNPAWWIITVIQFNLLADQAELYRHYLQISGDRMVNWIFF